MNQPSFSPILFQPHISLNYYINDPYLRFYDATQIEQGVFLPIDYFNYERDNGSDFDTDTDSDESDDTLTSYDGYYTYSDAYDRSFNNTTNHTNDDTYDSSFNVTADFTFSNDNGNNNNDNNNDDDDDVTVNSTTSVVDTDDDDSTDDSTDDSIDDSTDDSTDDGDNTDDYTDDNTDDDTNDNTYNDFTDKVNIHDSMSRNNDTDGETCAICFDELESDLIDSLTVMSCGHTLHTKCYKKLVKFLINKCPLCREIIN